MGKLDGKITLITGGTEAWGSRPRPHLRAQRARCFLHRAESDPADDLRRSIILNGSFIGSSGTPGMTAYGATKAAVRSVARTVTTELAGKGPRVNVLSPGPIDTEGFRRETDDDPKVREATVGMVPIGRMGDPREIGRAAVFFASDDSSFCAGAEFFIDGGTASV